MCVFGCLVGWLVVWLFVFGRLVWLAVAGLVGLVGLVWFAPLQRVGDPTASHSQVLHVE